MFAARAVESTSRKTGQALGSRHECGVARRAHCLQAPLLGRRKINPGHAFRPGSGHQGGLVTFMHYDLCFFNHETGAHRMRAKSLRGTGVTYVCGPLCQGSCRSDLQEPIPRETTA
jgi:hypothetical protein